MSTKQKKVSGDQFSLPFKKTKERVKSSKKNPVMYKREFPSYELEKEYEGFDFIAWPFVVLSGLLVQTDNLYFPTVAPIEKSLAELFGVSFSKKNRELIEKFIEKESRRFKHNPKVRRGHRAMTEKDFTQAIQRGLEYCLRLGMTPKKLRTTLRSHEPRTGGLPLKYSTIGRLVWNGHQDSNWYEETRETLVRVFPGYDIGLLCDLFATTSIRASLESNVTKFFKALRQYHEKQVHVSWIGIKGNKRKFESIFHGFLDATLVNLEKIAQGKRPGHPSQSGRKIYNFSEAMNGNKRAIVADIWIMRAFEIDLLRSFLGKDVSRSPDMHTYNTVEWYLQTLGDFLQREPRGVCSAIWCAMRWEEGSTSNTTRYDEFVKFRMNHGLFGKIYGKLSTSSFVFEEISE
jgi:hypothetical protein